ncbi:hypothetical protein CARUB_v10007899mg [Capsella rubella]|uniref:Uncharacterized protein n=1 Tax=Capsella rubella TaxID=81985 RepID=R0G6H2_9BRAS|nr:uncharacterized protein LOC17874314 [Capsella rubella]EOA12084.1 hypothetical protein CARUB_v10007899mg [Capsella rubella]
MPKERPIFSKVSNNARVSPYPDRRSSKSIKQVSHESKFSVHSEWEDVMCVICMEPPHNAVLLRCSSYSKGCRPYMCDTNLYHSNCFNQFSRNNRHHSNVKTLSCPLCRGEVYGTVYSTSGRRFMNAKPRPCSVDKCKFSGTYSKLDKHFITAHMYPNTPNVDPLRQWTPEQIHRSAQYMEQMSQTEIPYRLQVVQNQFPYIHHPSMIQRNVNGTVQSLLYSRQETNHFGLGNNTTYSMPRPEFQAMSMFYGWVP